MSNIYAIYRREFQSYFNSPIAYLAITVFWVIVGILFFIQQDFFAANTASLRGLFEVIPAVFVFFLPAISMRLLSEEKKSGTMELLITMPVSDTQIVLGKLFAAVGFLAVALSLTFLYAIVVIYLGNPDLGPIFGGYLGLLLVGTAYLSIGLMVSTWTSNQIIAFVVTLLFCGFFYFIDSALGAVWEGTQEFFNYVSFNFHFQNISKGVLDTRDVIFYLSVITVSVLVAAYSLKSRNWK